MEIPLDQQRQSTSHDRIVWKGLLLGAYRGASSRVHCLLSRKSSSRWEYCEGRATLYGAKPLVAGVVRQMFWLCDGMCRVSNLPLVVADFRCGSKARIVMALIFSSWLDKMFMLTLPGQYSGGLG